MSQFSLKQENVLDADVFTFDDGGDVPSSGDATLDVVNFTTPAKREPITSGSTLAKMFGSIKRWFTDLKAVCFSGSYNDLIDLPNLDLKADQSSLDTTNASLSTLTTTVGTKADQSDLDTTNDNIDAVIDEIYTVDGKVFTNTGAINTLQSSVNTLKGTSGLYEKANKSALDALATNVNTLKGTSGLYEKANKSALDALAINVDSKASWTSLNSLSSTVNAIIAGVDTAVTNLSTLATTVGTKASQSDLNILKGSGGLYEKANKAVVDYLEETIYDKADRTPLNAMMETVYSGHSVGYEFCIGQYVKETGSQVPLYRRCIKINNLGTGTAAAPTYTNYLHDVENIGICIINQAFTINASGKYIQFPVPGLATATGNSAVISEITTTNVQVKVMATLTNFSAMLWLEYTKTTD